MSEQDTRMQPGDLPRPQVASGSRSPAKPRPANSGFAVTSPPSPAAVTAPLGSRAPPPPPTLTRYMILSGRRGPRRPGGDRRGAPSDTPPHALPLSVPRSETEASECLRLPAGCLPRGGHQRRGGRAIQGSLGLLGGHRRSEKLPQTLGPRGLAHLRPGPRKAVSSRTCLPRKCSSACRSTDDFFSRACRQSPWARERGDREDDAGLGSRENLAEGSSGTGRRPPSPAMQTAVLYLPCDTPRPPSTSAASPRDLRQHRGPE
ncbi:actin nucleation-promoting factor WAS-like [Artibeus jamaicensis]|uniref:actin nucleation-promoting factor WAS-like n=1 Tax=Artibeus jamaicensis TaxID=9417 RepID=UPI00235B1D58|nr:actin nucleation-promoting factor WAS-like [Artibeus jamaicensis]